MGENVARYGPGLGLLLAVAVPAMLIQHQITVSGRTVVSAVAIAIVIGVNIVLTGLQTSADKWERQ